MQIYFSKIVKNVQIVDIKWLFSDKWINNVNFIIIFKTIISFSLYLNIELFYDKY
jgi:hypothetical protein